MGAEGSKDGAGATSVGGAGSSSSSSGRTSTLNRFSRRSNRTLIARWQKRQQAVQLFSVCRHAERADGIYAFIGGQRWSSTEDFRQWPLDPPLSDAGLEAAQEMGQSLEQSAREQDSVMHVVISSPYYRCIQTAVLICRSLGPGVRLLVDRSLGEVYGPSVMGSVEPAQPVRGLDQTLAFCKLMGVTCQSRVIGSWPTWPEQLRDARRRYALRFLSYLQRSVTTRRNFVLVAHADCVGAVLSTIPSQMNKVVEKVEYGGMFIAKRSRPETKKSKGSSSGSFSSVLPATAEEAGEGGDSNALADFEGLAEVGSFQQLVPVTRRGNWTEEDKGKGNQVLHQPKASDAWEVVMEGVSVRKREGAGKFRKRLRDLAARADFTVDKVEQLLGEMGDKPLGGDEEHCVSSAAFAAGAAGNGGAPIVPTCCSFSTYLFGSSEIGEDGRCGSFSEISDVQSTCSRIGSEMSLGPNEALHLRQVGRTISAGAPGEISPRRENQSPRRVNSNRRSIGTCDTLERLARCVGANGSSPIRAQTLQSVTERAPAEEGADELEFQITHSRTPTLPVRSIEIVVSKLAEDDSLKTVPERSSPPGKTTSFQGLDQSSLLRQRFSSGTATAASSSADAAAAVSAKDQRSSAPDAVPLRALDQSSLLRRRRSSMTAAPVKREGRSPSPEDVFGAVEECSTPPAAPLQTLDQSSLFRRRRTANTAVAPKRTGRSPKKDGHSPKRDGHSPSPEEAKTPGSEELCTPPRKYGSGTPARPMQQHQLCSPLLEQAPMAVPARAEVPLQGKEQSSLLRRRQSLGTATPQPRLAVVTPEAVQAPTAAPAAVSTPATAWEVDAPTAPAPSPYGVVQLGFGGLGPAPPSGMSEPPTEAVQAVRLLGSLECAKKPPPLAGSLEFSDMHQRRRKRHSMT